jgi:tetratricopeptide (TPR) repeat protein
MRRLFDRAKAELADFTEQRKDLGLIATCSDEDAALLLQLLGDLDQGSDSDLFLLFGSPFERADSYVGAVIAELDQEHQAADAELVKAGKPPLPPLPPELRSPEPMPPWKRLEAAVVFGRSLLPREGGRRLVWAMVPARIADRDGYLELVAHLLPRESLRPWMPHVRLVIRDVKQTEREHPVLRAGARRTRLWTGDFGPAALAASLSDAANDESAPMTERMEALLSSAVLDHAHDRPEQAIDKFKTLLGYFHRTENQPMKALVMNAIGDVFRRLGKTEQALNWYECAVEAVAEARAPVVLATIVNNLGGVSFELRRFDQAEQYFDQLDKLASAMLDAQTKALALEWRGLSQRKLDRNVDAIKSWEAAATVSRSLGLDLSLKRNLQLLETAYARLGLPDRAQRTRQELGSLPAERT